jgi:hypothetical protein
MFVKMLTHSHLRWYTYGVDTFAKGLKIWLMVLVCGGSWLEIQLLSKVFWVKHSVGMDSPLNKLSIESKIT